MNASKSRVLVAMSGGVDSSVAAGLLKEQGYDVVGMFMRVGSPQSEDTASLGDARFLGEREGPARLAIPEVATCLTAAGSSHDARRRGTAAQGEGIRLPLHRPNGEAGRPHQGCCSAVDAADARAVAGLLGIPFYAVNFEADFSALIDYFVDEYARARTPNPCVACNQHLKFGKLMHYADVVEADYVATGHYARVDHASSRPRLLRGRDAAKDQSYVLFGLAPSALRRTLFPLGGLTKHEVRANARRMGLRLADKPDSQDICFVPDRDYARVVRSRRPGAFRPGRIRHVDGRDVGEHSGLPNYTIGQRRGLRIAMGEPVYVVALDRDTDTVWIGSQDDLLALSATASGVNWLIEPPAAPFHADVKIRYHHEPAAAEVHPLDGGRVRVRFDVPQAAVTPGQAMVIYRDDEVLGGGWIDSPAPRGLETVAGPA